MRLLIFIALIIFAIWSGGFMWFTQASRSIHIGEQQHADLIIVLTGGEQRINYGMRLFEEGLAKKVFISGVDRNVQAKDLNLTDHCCVTLGHEATNTVGNALEVQQWLADKNHAHDYQTALLITSDYHILRSLLLFRQILPNLFVQPYIVQTPPWHSSTINFRLYIREYNKYIAQLVMRMFGRIEI